MQIRVVEDEGEKGDRNSEDDQEFLKKIEQTMLSQVVLQGVPGVKKVFLRDAKSTFPDASPNGDGYKDQNEWVLDTEGTNLLEVCGLHFVVYGTIVMLHSQIIAQPPNN